MKMEIVSFDKVMSVFSDKMKYPVACLRPGESFFVPNVNAKNLRPRIEKLMRQGANYSLRTVKDDEGNILGSRMWRLPSDSYIFEDYPENTSEYEIEKDIPIQGNSIYSPFLSMNLDQVAVIKEIDEKKVTNIRSILSTSKSFQNMKFQTRFLKEQGTLYVKRVA